MFDELRTKEKVRNLKASPWRKEDRMKLFVFEADIKVSLVGVREKKLNIIRSLPFYM